MFRTIFDVIFSRKLVTNNPLAFFLLAATLALAIAYISQYFFGLQPCQLCLWQRKPFFAIIIVAGLFLAIPKLKKYQNWGVRIAVLLLLVNSALAFYHNGVEKKWFHGLDSCATSFKDPSSLEELKLALETTKAVRCDVPQFVFLGISMAGWNVLYCLGLISFASRKRQYTFFKLCRRQS